MVQSEINNLESSLDIVLPKEYFNLVIKFPLEFGKNSTDYFLWDNAEKLISENLRLRKEGRWNSAWFLIGDDGAGWQHVVNLREETPTVKDVEFEDIRKIVSVPKFTPYPCAVDRASLPGCPNHTPIHPAA